MAGWASTDRQTDRQTNSLKHTHAHTHTGSQRDVAWDVVNLEQNASLVGRSVDGSTATWWPVRRASNWAEYGIGGRLKLRNSTSWQNVNSDQAAAAEAARCLSREADDVFLRHQPAVLGL